MLCCAMNNSLERKEMMGFELGSMRAFSRNMSALVVLWTARQHATF